MIVQTGCCYPVEFMSMFDCVVNVKMVVVGRWQANETYIYCTYNMIPGRHSTTLSSLLQNTYGRPDEVVAAETLANHLRCNSSFIHDIFQVSGESDRHSSRGTVTVTCSDYVSAWNVMQFINFLPQFLLHLSSLRACCPSSPFYSFYCNFDSLNSLRSVSIVQFI